MSCSRAPAARPEAGSSSRISSAPVARTRAMVRVSALHRRGSHARVGAIGEADMVEAGAGFASAAALCAADMEWAEHGADRLLTALVREADEHVVLGREVGEEAEVLEGAADAGVDDGLGREAIERAALEGDGAFLGPEEAGDDVEDGGLAGAVGADEAGDEALGDGEGGAIQRLEAAEALLEACCGKVGQGGACAHAAIVSCGGWLPQGVASVAGEIDALGCRCLWGGAEDAAGLAGRWRPLSQSVLGGEVG